MPAPTATRMSSGFAPKRWPISPTALAGRSRAVPRQPAWTAPMEVQSHQVHEDTVRHVTGADRGKGLFAATDYTADALVTDEPGLSLMVFSADCIILLLHDPVTASIGAVHARGRRRCSPL